MSEENLEVTQEQQPQEEVKVSKYEQQALEQGWKPKEEWEGDPEEWRPAKEFVERGELFTKISSQNSELKEVRRALQALGEHHRKVKETEFNRAIQYLRDQKKVALENGDADKVVEVDEALADMKEQKKAFESMPEERPQTNAHPSFVSFVQRNSWYNTDPELRAFADEIGVGKKATSPDIGPDELFSYVEKQVKKSFKEKFEKQKPIPTVEGGSGGSSKQSVKEYPLTEDERRTMMTFVRQNVMTKEEYIEQLKAVKGEK